MPSPLLSVMIDAAREAGRIARKGFYNPKSLTLTYKSTGELATSADIKAERCIRDKLAAARPLYGMLLEEGGRINNKDNSNRWIVDPIDGTKNFAHGLAHFAISIGLERDRIPFAGVIYQPVHDELFYAERGTGAYLNNRRIRVSACEKLSEALIGVSKYYSLPQQPLQLPCSTRHMGALSLDLAFTACGRLDAFLSRNHAAWDVCAGLAILREAGGMATAFPETKEKTPPHLSKSLIAGTSRILEALQSLMHASAASYMPGQPGQAKRQAKTTSRHSQDDDCAETQGQDAPR